MLSRPEQQTGESRPAAFPSPASDAEPRSAGIEITPASNALTVQRQNGGDMGNGGTDGGGAQTASTTGATSPGTTRTGTWSADDIVAILMDKDPSHCLGSARSSGTKTFSNRCGPIKGPFCQAAGINFQVDFVVDFADAPRPAGFTPPTVSVHFEFKTAGGATKLKIDNNDASPKYISAGAPLEPSFGHDFPVSTAESGNLFVDLHIFDPDSGVSVDYLDNIKFVVTPCT